MENIHDLNGSFNEAAIISGLIEKLRANYIFPELAEQICASLQNHLDAGEYADLEDRELFALALTMHMQEVCHDEHLWVRWHAEPLPVEDDPLRLNPEWQAQRRMEAEQDNYGLRRLEKLDGKVGLIEIAYFHRPEWAGNSVSEALRTLDDTQALIFDLRQCTGGYPGMVALVAGSLFKEPVHLSSIYWRDEDRMQEYWTQPGFMGERFVDKPAWVLISKTTFSAGEEFAYDLQALRRAIVVGEKTDGGAHPGASYRLHPHFEVFIPIGRTINSMTGSNWQGCGVTPDVIVDPEQALQVATSMALKSIANL